MNIFDEIDASRIVGAAQAVEDSVEEEKFKRLHYSEPDRAHHEHRLHEAAAILRALQREAFRQGKVANWPGRGE